MPRAILQAITRLQEALRTTYGDRWTLALQTPDAVITTARPYRLRRPAARATGSREKQKPPRTQTRRSHE